MSETPDLKSIAVEFAKNMWAELDDDRAVIDGLLLELKLGQKTQFVDLEAFSNSKKIEMLDDDEAVIDAAEALACIADKARLRDMIFEALPQRAASAEVSTAFKDRGKAALAEVCRWKPE